MTTTSELSGFYLLDLEGRRQRIGECCGLSPAELDVLSGTSGLRDEQANRMVENAIGLIGMPLGVCMNLLVDGCDRIVPMAIEEPSVVAAASFAAKLLRAGGGVVTEVSPPHMIGQVQLLDVPDPVAAEAAVLAAQREIIGLANEGHPLLVAANGGAVALETHHLAPLSGDDPVGPMMVVHLVVDVRDAMGANAINSMCESVAPRLAELSGGRVGLRILSNLADRRTVTARGCVPFEALVGRGRESPASLARGIVEASVFAERDPYRAATHNKGVMNGVDSVLLAFGQDWRAVEAGAHAFASRGGRYTALARWRIEGEMLTGVLQLPMSVGTVGGVAGVHPTVKVARKLAGVRGAADLASLTASVGLAQNLGALRALAAEGIQKGHMRLHARNLAVQAGALGEEVDEIARELAERGAVNLNTAMQVVAERQRLRREASRVPEVYRSAQSALLDRFEQLRSRYWPRMESLMGEVVGEAAPRDSTLAIMCDYHLKTGGRRVRAMLPLVTAEALGADPEGVVAFGAACEMLHNATLVHDDLQGGVLVRRGAETVWHRFGVAQAINLGDAMLCFAVLLCTKGQGAQPRREAIVKRMLGDALRVIDGRELDRVVGASDTPALADALRALESKTADVFALPMMGAAMLCGAPPELVSALAEAARHVGVLFQLQDEAVNLWGERRAEVRSTGIIAGKRNALVAYALEHATEDDARTLARILDKDRNATTERDIDEAILVLGRAGSLAFARDEIARRRQRALGVAGIEKLPELQALLTELCTLFAAPVATL